MGQLVMICVGIGFCDRGNVFIRIVWCSGSRRALGIFEGCLAVLTCILLNNFSYLGLTIIISMCILRKISVFNEKIVQKNSPAISP